MPGSKHWCLEIHRVRLESLSCCSPRLPPFVLCTKKRLSFTKKHFWPVLICLAGRYIGGHPVCKLHRRGTFLGVFYGICTINDTQGRAKEAVEGSQMKYISKELVPLKHLVKLRKSSLQMILPDIRKCSKSDHSMSDNRFSCFRSFGAIY